MLESLQRGFDNYHVDPELRDVQDHVLRVTERTDSFRTLLQNTLTLHSTLITQRQNEASLAQSESVKKISAWAAVFFGPACIATIYGMNFEIMPELQTVWGYLAALVAMLATGAGLYAMFRVKKWL